MRAVILEVPQAMLDERRLLGLDKRDEMWDGELHMVPPAGNDRQRLCAAFFRAVVDRAEARGLEALWETGLFRSAEDYRVPDLVFLLPEQSSERGVEDAELLVEVRSPRDETYRKLAFYAVMGVRELLVLHPAERRAELFRLIDGELRTVSPDPAAGLHCEVLDVWLATVEGKLRIAWAEGSIDI